MIVTIIVTFDLTDNIIKQLSYNIILLLKNQFFINNFKFLRIFLMSLM